MKVKLSLLIPRITWEWQYHLWPSPGWRYCTAKVSPHKRCPDGTGCKVLGVPVFRDSRCPTTASSDPNPSRALPTRYALSNPHEGADCSDGHPKTGCERNLERATGSKRGKSITEMNPTFILQLGLHAHVPRRLSRVLYKKSTGT